MLQRTGRRLLVSPWFAAGAGFVIATGVIIYTPHANFAIDVQKCQLVSCTKLAPQGPAPGIPAGTGGGRVTAPSTRSVPRGTTFWYQPVDYSTRYGFSMWIKIQAPYSTSQWKLSFVIRGASGIYVFGAPHWEPYGTDGVTVSNLIAVTESAGYAPISGQQDNGNGLASRDVYIVLFQIRGSGTPSRPSQCVYNGATCHFKLSNDLSPAR
jgi:hypothetical protein